MGFPAVWVPVASTEFSFSSDLTTTVTLFGAGPGLYFDFAGFIFHVPVCPSAAAVATHRNIAARNTVVPRMAHFLVCMACTPQLDWGRRTVATTYARYFGICPESFSASIRARINNRT